MGREAFFAVVAHSSSSGFSLMSSMYMLSLIEPAVVEARAFR